MKKNILLSFAIFCLGIGTGKAQFTDVHNFNGIKGAEPFGSLTPSQAGVLYGTAYLGGAHDSGCIFAINADGNNYRDLFDFIGPSGSEPNSPVTLIAGKLYGSANAGGAHDSGCIFSVDTNGSNYRDLFDFSGPNGKNPYNALVFDSSSGVLYGVADGGAYHVGCIFSIDTNGSGYRDLFDFDTINGEFPLGLTLYKGILYGTTLEGGLYKFGLVFSIDTNGSNYKDLFDFNNTNGLFPYGALTYSAGTLYGATADGGANGYGLVFSIDTNGTNYKDLFDFNNTNGSQPEYAGGSLTLTGNLLFGTTYNGAAHDSGCIFSMYTNGSAYKDLYDFTGPDGAHPEGSLTLLGSTLYGATAFGGTNHQGVIFAFDTASPVVMAKPDSICKGDTALIFVNGVNGATYTWGPGGETTDTIQVSPSISTTYTITSIQGVTHYTNYLVLTVVPLPAPVIKGTSFKCKGKTDTLTVSGGTTYLWSNGSTTTIYFTGPIEADSTITVVAYNSLGCSDTAHFYITVDINCPTGISEIQDQSQFQVFPNPNSGKFIIQASNGNVQSSIIEIYNVLGEKVYTQSITKSSRLTIDLSSQPNGIYLYRVLTYEGEPNGEGKLIIQK